MVGANPLKEGPLASKKAFVVVQDMFLTETAQRADVVLPAASAYEKNGTVTNVCGEVQRLKRAISTIGAKTGSRNHRPDREGNGLRAADGAVAAGTVYNEIRSTVKGYDIPLALVDGGRAADHAGERPSGRGEPARPDLVRARQSFHVGNAGTVF